MDGRLDGVGAVFRGPGAVAAAHGFHVAVIGFFSRIVSGKTQVADNALPAGGNSAGQCLVHGGEGEFGSELREFPRANHGGRPRGGEHGIIGTRHLHASVEAVVDQDAGIDQALDDDRDGRQGRRACGVQRAGLLRGGSGDVKRGVSFANSDRDGDPDRFVVESVAVAVSGGFIFTGRQRGDFAARPPFRVVEQFVEKRDDLSDVITVDQFSDAPRAHQVCSHLCAQIASGLLGRAHVLQNEAQDVLVDFTAPHDFRGRYDDAFLVDFTVYAQAARRASPHVHVVGHVGEVPEPVLTGINRRDEGDVVEVAASTMWVVKDNAVPGREIPGAVFPQRVRYGGLQGREMRRL